MTIFARMRARGRLTRHWRGLIARTARDPQPYRQGLAADTMEGRQQMLSLVTALVVHRFQAAKAPDEKLIQAIYHAVFESIDDALREEGVGDASIARKMRKIGEEFVGLGQALDKALKGTEGEARAVEIADLLARNGVCSREKAPDLCAWLLSVHTALAQLSDSDLLSGKVPDLLNSSQLG